jgi:LAO/AO transport system kinase
MQEHFGDPEVFIRSVATRGALGGLSRTASDVARVLAAWGADIVLIETVGVGQDELDVMRVAHTTLVVQAPGAGDELQASKAGLMECADVFAVNKADRPGAEAAVRHLRAMIALGQLVGSDRLVAARGHSAAASLSSAEPDGQGSEGAEAWVPCVVSCSATAGLGFDELAQRLSEHRAWLEASEAGRRRRLSRLADELASRIRDALSRAIFERNGEEIEQAALRIVSAATDPYTASRDIVEGLLRRGPSSGH